MTLTPATASEQSAAKIGFIGPPGSGKSLTAALLGLGIAKTLHQGAPVAFFDTSGESDFLASLFALEQVPLVRTRARSFLEMGETLKVAERAGACCLIIDSYAHPWLELNAALRERANLVGRRLQVHHRDELASVWSAWVAQMMASRVHCLLVGQLAFDEPEEEGMTIVKTRGQTDTGYEPHLLVECEALADFTRARASHRTRGVLARRCVAYHCHVLKDHGRALTGQAFAFRSVQTYKAGDYAQIFDAFAPHLAQLNLTAPEIRPSLGSSAGLFAVTTGDTPAVERARRVKIATEEIEGSFTALWPGRDVQSGLLKNAALDALFGTRSWTAVEHKPAEVVEAAAEIMRRVEGSLAAGAKLDSVAGVAKAIEGAWGTIHDGGGVADAEDDELNTQETP